MHKICGNVEIVPRVIPAGGRGWEARIDVVFRGEEGQSVVDGFATGAAELHVRLAA